MDVSTTPPANAPIMSWDSWRPDFSRYRAVINNFNGGPTDAGIRWPGRVEEALEAYVRGGGGLVVYHAANNAFLHWSAYNDMIGLGWRGKDFGPGLTILPGGQVVRIAPGTGLDPGHGPRHSFEVHVLAAHHPVTRGLPASEISHQNEPMDWVRNYGKGRVYTTMLGHTWQDEPNPNLRCPEFRKLFAQGVEWAAANSGR